MTGCWRRVTRMTRYRKCVTRMTRLEVRNANDGAGSAKREGRGWKCGTRMTRCWQCATRMTGLEVRNANDTVQEVRNANDGLEKGRRSTRPGATTGPSGAGGLRGGAPGLPRHRGRRQGLGFRVAQALTRPREGRGCLGGLALRLLHRRLPRGGLAFELFGLPTPPRPLLVGGNGRRAAGRLGLLAPRLAGFRLAPRLRRRRMSLLDLGLFAPDTPLLDLRLLVPDELERSRNAGQHLEPRCGHLGHEPTGAKLGGEPPIDGRAEQGVGDAAGHRGCEPVALAAETFARAIHERLQIGALLSERLGRPARIPQLGGPNASDRVDQSGQALRIRMGELVDGPQRDGRPAQLLHSPRLLRLTG